MWSWKSPGTAICGALACQLHIPNNFTFGQSKKAICHESQIGPCVATHQVDNCQAWSFQKANGVVTTVKWNHRGNRNKYLAAFRDEANRTPEQDHSQIVGARPLSLAECREKNLSAPSRGGDVSLDIRLYRTASG